MTRSTILLFFTGTAAAFTGSSILFDLFWKDRARIDTRVNERLKGKLKKKAQASSLLRNLGKQVSDELKPDFNQKIELLIEQSGLELTQNRFWALTTVTAIVAAGVGYAALGGILFAIPAAVDFLQLGAAPLDLVLVAVGASAIGSLLLEVMHRIVSRSDPR